MDIIHANSSLEEIGYIKEINNLDIELSQESDATIANNSFSLKINDEDWETDPIEVDHYIYIPDTEWGGRIDGISHSTASSQVTVSGLTWRGMLYRKIIEPTSGENYKVITSTEANTAIADLIGTSLGDLFTVSTNNSGITIASKSFRYTNLLLGIEDMLADEGAALQMAFSQADKKVTLSTRTIVDYSDTVDLSQDYGVDMVTTIGGYDRFNHIIALGAGELADRDIIHVYRNTDGTLTTSTPAWAGTLDDEVTIYNYTNPEDINELQGGAETKAKEYAPYNTVEMDPSVDELELLLGDKVGARDKLTGLQAITSIVGKILTMNTSGIKIETRVK